MAPDKVTLQLHGINPGVGKYEDPVCNHLKSLILDSREEFALGDGMKEINGADGTGMEE